MKVYLDYMAERFSGAVTNPELPNVTVGRMNLSDVNLTNMQDEFEHKDNDEDVTISDSYDNDVRDSTGELSAAEIVETDNQPSNDTNIE